MTLRTAGGLAALTCAATYLVGFALLVTLLAPLGFGTREIDAAAVTGFIAARPGLLIAWNTTIYIVNALALVVLVVALRQQAGRTAPDAAALAAAFGLIWATLVLAAGMLANVAVARSLAVFASDPSAAAALWETLHAVELGLGGGNEIAGGVWLIAVSLSARACGLFGRVTAGLGGLSGLAGLATILPPLGETAGAVFGLGALLWFAAVGRALLHGRQTSGGRGPVRSPPGG